MKVFTGLCLVLLVLLLSISMVQKHAAEPATDYRLKAIFLFNFTQFIEWPTKAFPQANTPFVIGVLGKNPFNTYLNEAVKREKVNGHPIVVKYYLNAEKVEKCHILLVNLQKPEEIKQALERLK